MAAEAGKLLLDLALLIAAAKLGGWAMERMGQPAVVGELLVGVLLAPTLLGQWLQMPDLGITDSAATTPASHPDLPVAFALTALATIGAVLLLFEVGLESNVKDLAKVGVASTLVAILGIVVSFAAGYAGSYMLAQVWEPWKAASDAIDMQLLHVFMGATLTATSVGITARVLGEMGKLRSNEARIVLGAAVLDDIAGLLILAVVSATVEAATAGTPVDLLEFGRIAATAIGFLVVALVVGLRVVPRAFDALTARVPSGAFAVGVAISFALLMAYLAEVFNLANIVGAFAAGLLLAQSRSAHRLFEDLRPVAALLVSFFFVTLGMRVDLTQMGDHTIGILVFGVILAVVAILAKLAAGLGVIRARASRMVVGVGMVPRGEVGLIFAGVGLTSGVITNWQYTMVLLIVLITTFVTPVWLARLKDRFRGEHVEEAPSAQKMGRILGP